MGLHVAFQHIYTVSSNQLQPIRCKLTSWGAVSICMNSSYSSFNCYNEVKLVAFKDKIKAY